MKLLKILLVGLIITSASQAAISIDTVYVGDAGNANDSTGYGGVSYGYHIGTYEVTNSQYTAFLNAKATTDPNGLYSGNMYGITRSGVDGSYAYTATSANTPVNFVSFWRAARFTNWLTNGQGSGDTETGVYVLTPTGISNNTITRDATAWNAGGVAIASEDEWYKAAYYSGSPTGADGDGYWLYPTQSNSITTADANYSGSNLTDVGTYSGDASHYGTFDQGGNLWEWNDAIVSASGRGARAGSFANGEDKLRSSSRSYVNPASDHGVKGFGLIGFRVSSLAPIPEPPSFEPELELQVSTDGLSTWDAVSVTPEMLTPDGKIQPGVSGADSAAYRMYITEAE